MRLFSKYKYKFIGFFPLFGYNYLGSKSKRVLVLTYIKISYGWKVKGTMENAKIDITVCYSGGLDSTYVAYIMGKEYGGKVHLLTMIPYGQLFYRWSERHVKDLKRLLGEDRVIHTYVDTKELFYNLTVKNFFREWKEYKSHFVWCLGCQSSLVAKVIIYNLENQIPYVMFASSVGGQYAVMSMPVTHKNWRNFYAEFGIKFRTPLIELNIEKEQEREELKKLGVWIGIRFNRAVLGVQPLCVPGWQHIMDILFNIHTTYNPVEVDRYFKDKSDFLRKHIYEYFEKKNMDIKKLIEGVKKKRETYESLKNELQEGEKIEKVPLEI